VNEVPGNTAIVISDTDASLRFYRGLLGMHVAGESENYGTEHEHLNNVFGAHLKITALRGAEGPGIELLEYVSPRDGRPYPTDERANDVVHRPTVLVTRNADQAVRDLSLAKVNFVSSGLDCESDLRAWIQDRVSCQRPGRPRCRD